MKRRGGHDRIRDIILGFVIGTGGLIITLSVSRHYDLGRAGTLLVFWLTGIGLLILYFAYLIVAALIRGKSGSNGTVDGAPQDEASPSFAQWIQTFILLFNLGAAAILAYVFRHIYSFGIFISFLIGLGTFVVLNGAMTALESRLTRFFQNRKGS